MNDRGTAISLVALRWHRDRARWKASWRPGCALSEDDQSWSFNERHHDGDECLDSGRDCICWLVPSWLPHEQRLVSRSIVAHVDCMRQWRTGLGVRRKDWTGIGRRRLGGGDGIGEGTGGAIGRGRTSLVLMINYYSLVPCNQSRRTNDDTKQHSRLVKIQVVSRVRRVGLAHSPTPASACACSPAAA
jgi:hypothetical protein